MNYKYSEIKKSLFTEEGIDTIIKIRDNAFRLIGVAGCCTLGNAIEGTTGDSWLSLAAVDFLVERGDLHKVDGTYGSITQNQILRKG